MESEIRKKQIENNMPLVGYVTARFTGRGYEYEDLYQYGCIGLIKAVDRFEPEYGVKFSTYAVPLIIGEIKRFIRGDGSIHVSRTIREHAGMIMRIMDECEKEGTEMTVEEISEKTGLAPQETVLAMTALVPVKSLYDPVSGEGEILLQDTLGTEEDGNANDSIAIDQAMECLNEKERVLIRRRYFERDTQTSIAAEYGMTQVQISRMEKKALAKLREILK